jgi:hypothetical protein
MTRTITIAAVVVAILGTLGLVTSASARQPKKIIKVTLPPKSCLWMGSGTDHFKTVDSGKTTRDKDSGTVWKCTNGSWKQVGGPPLKDTRPSGGSTGGSRV